MLIDDIKPYEKNARHNEKAIPVVAESIKEFGLKGQIVLESRDNPVIVAGHTRWAACKLLGWTEIPDERIDYCENLTPEQIKAYRLADNRTGEVATWNKTLLQHEVRDIKSLDMSKFEFNFKSKQRKFGAERLRTDDTYNLILCNIDDCGKDGFPRLMPSYHVPTELMGFNYAMTSDNKGAGIHFFIDDYQFERCWSNPMRYTEILRDYDCVLTPDFSLYLDMPYPMQQWNLFRSRALGMIWQREGLEVIPTLSWSTPRSYEFAFNGLSKGGTVAVSTVGVKRSEQSLSVWRDGMGVALKKLEPDTVLLYGGMVDFDFGNVEIAEFSNSVTDRMKNGR